MHSFRAKFQTEVRRKENKLMFLKSMIRRATLAALLTIGTLSTVTFAMDNEQRVALEKEGTELIGQLEDVARDIQFNADQLHVLSRQVRASKWTHYHHLEQIKSLVNDGLQPALSRLTEIQPQLPEWKRESINRMLASARALAGDANSAILNRNEHGSAPTPLNAEYVTLIKSITEHSENLVKTADVAGEYATAHFKATEAGLPVHQH
jgi:hypothetical protein